VSHIPLDRPIITTGASPGEDIQALAEAGVAGLECNCAGVHWNQEMTSDDLTPEQAQILCDAVRRSLRYLGRLQDRMRKAGFPPDDLLLQIVTKAFSVVHHLSIDLHYRSCKSGVSRPSKRKPDSSS
jgi:hypothetical protein